MPMTFTDRARLAWRILRASADSNSLKHAESELLLAFPPDDGDSDMPGWNDAMRQQCLEVLLVFAIQGNSGGSAAMAIPTIKRLMEQEPLTPITGEDDRWNEVGEGVFQHRRCSHVFKDADRSGGQPYTINGYVFIEDWTDPETQKVHEVAFTGMGSARAISFPWWPVGPTRVRVDAEGNRLDGQPRLAIMPEIEAAPTNAAFIQCDCDCGTSCPQGKTGTEAKCFIPKRKIEAGEESNPVRMILSATIEHFRKEQASYKAQWDAMTDHERQRSVDFAQSPAGKAAINGQWAAMLDMALEALAR